MHNHTISLNNKTAMTQTSWRWNDWNDTQTVCENADKHVWPSTIF